LETLWLNGNRINGFSGWIPHHDQIDIKAIQSLIDFQTNFSELLNDRIGWPIFLPKLQTLYLQDNMITSIPLGSLIGLPNLITIDLSFNNISQEIDYLGLWHDRLQEINTRENFIISHSFLEMLCPKMISSALNMKLDVNPILKFNLNLFLKNNLYQTNFLNQLSPRFIYVCEIIKEYLKFNNINIISNILFYFYKEDNSTYHIKEYFQNLIVNNTKKSCNNSPIINLELNSKTLLIEHKNLCDLHKFAISMGILKCNEDTNNLITKIQRLYRTHKTFRLFKKIQDERNIISKDNIFNIFESGFSEHVQTCQQDKCTQDNEKLVYGDHKRRISHFRQHYNDVDNIITINPIESVKLNKKVNAVEALASEWKLNNNSKLLTTILKREKKLNKLRTNRK
jgi:hypothetical protein